MLPLIFIFVICVVNAQNILWNQTASTGSVVWYATRDILNGNTVFAADDFEIPQTVTMWNITQIKVFGQTSGNAENDIIGYEVIFYSDVSNSYDSEPGLILGNYTISGYRGLSPNLPISPALTLSPGRYWFSVIALLNSTLSGSKYYGVHTANTTSQSYGQPVRLRDKTGFLYSPAGVWIALEAVQPDWNDRLYKNADLRFQIYGIQSIPTTGYLTTKEMTTGLSTGSITSESVTSSSLTTSEPPPTPTTDSPPLSSASLTTVQYTSNSITTGRSVTSSSQNTTSSITSDNSVTTGNNSSDEKGSNLVLIIVAVVVVVVAVITLVAVVAYIMRGKKAKKQDNSSEMKTLKPLRSAKDSNYESISLANSSQSALLRSGNSVSNDEPLPFVIAHKELILDKEIGRGAFGAVFRGRWRGGAVAIKQILFKNSLSEKEMKDFKDEAKVMQKLRPHVNVVQFLGITVAPDPLCIVTELMDMGSLYSFLRENTKIDVYMLMNFLKGIAAGMLHLHKESIIHRDLACRNVLLGAGLNVKISDFGLSRVSSSEQSNQTVSDTGPLKWMSPEAIQDKIYSKASDVWSFGVTAWEIITKQDPYPELDAVQTAMQVTYHGLRLVVPGYAPPVVRQVITSCFANLPEDRPSFDIISERLQTATDAEWSSTVFTFGK